MQNELFNQIRPLLVPVSDPLIYILCTLSFMMSSDKDSSVNDLAADILSYDNSFSPFAAVLVWTRLGLCDVIPTQAASAPVLHLVVQTPTIRSVVRVIRDDHVSIRGNFSSLLTVIIRDLEIRNANLNFFRQKN